MIQLVVISAWGYEIYDLERKNTKTCESLRLTMLPLWTVGLYLELLASDRGQLVSRHFWRSPHCCDEMLACIHAPMRTQNLKRRVH